MVFARRWSIVAVAMVGAALFSEAARGTDYFISPSADDLQAFEDVLSQVGPGDTIYVHGGTYNFSEMIEVTTGGNSANPIKMFAVDGETPILDFSAQSLSNDSRGLRLSGGADWWHIKGLTIQNAGDNGFYTAANYGRFEQMVTRYNRDSGFQLHSTASYNLILNCDSYENYDPHNLGENADGFAAKSSSVGPGNIFRGTRAWGNSDDGYDVYYTVNYGILVQDSWAFDNGNNIDDLQFFAGDGNGFKLGTPGGPSVLVNVLAVDNPHYGLNINHNETGVQVYNATTLRNDPNWRFDEPISAQILQNNISHDGASPDQFHPDVSDSFNSWNGGVTLTDDDFVSLDRMVGGSDVLTAPRKADGSLPDLGDFLRLAPDSDLIDAGTPISFVFDGVTYNVPYSGLAPDLGAYESLVLSGVAGDYNNDGVVDAADYTVWRDNDGTDNDLMNDFIGGTIDEDQYTQWRDNFGMTAGAGAGGGGVASAPVPEPSSSALLIVAALLLVSFRSSRGPACGRIDARRLES